jgi:hypothetical protein
VNAVLAGADEADSIAIVDEKTSAAGMDSRTHERTADTNDGMTSP